MTQWFVLPRFGSCKPTPRWGGHKDRVSFNPFPLSNGHLDRVSFSSQSNRTPSSHKDHHTIGVSCFDYNDLGNKKWGRIKAIQAQEHKRTQKSLSLVTNLIGVIRCSVADDRWRGRLLLRLAHRTVRWIIAEWPPRIPEGGKFGVGFPGAPDGPVRQTRVAFGLSFALFIWTLSWTYIGLRWTFSTCRTHNLEQTS
jgi:hypothetical protein